MISILFKFRYFITLSLLLGIGGVFYNRKASPLMPPVNAAIGVQKLKIEPQFVKAPEKTLKKSEVKNGMEAAVGPDLQKSQPLPVESFNEKPARLSEKKRMDADVTPPLSPPYSPSPFSFEGSELTEEAVAPYIRPEAPPEAIHYYSESGNEKLVPKIENTQTASNGNGHVLSVATNGAVKKIADEREASANQRAETGTQESVSRGLQQRQTDSPTNTHTIDYPIQYGAFFSPVYFNAGKRNNKKTNVTEPIDWIQRVSGAPDFLFDHVAKGDVKHLEAIQSKVLSLGHGGEILFEIKNADFYYDRPGNDFSIYENVFTDERDGLNYQEYAHVGISDKRSDSSFLWFTCNPKNQDIKRCAGVVKTSDGGDRFDMAELGLKKIKFIKIIDTGDNYNPKYASKNTEGFDLDTIEFIR